MDSTQVLYTLLGIKFKIPDPHLRVLYLKEVWGLEQSYIGQLEGYSQPSVSRILKEASGKYTLGQMVNLTQIHWEEGEIKAIQNLPREIIQDVPLIAFIEYLLKLNISHPFFFGLGISDSMKIAGLSSLRVQNKHIQKFTKKSQPYISACIKRNSEAMERITHDTRYNFTNYTYKIAQKALTTVSKTGSIFIASQ